MKKNIFHELYGHDAKKKACENEGKCDDSAVRVKDSSVSCSCHANHPARLLCPECKSDKIKPATMTSVAIYGSPDQRYVCEDCGYTGSLVIDVSEHEKTEHDIAMEEDLMKIRKELGL